AWNGRRAGQAVRPHAVVSGPVSPGARGRQVRSRRCVSPAERGHDGVMAKRRFSDLSPRSRMLLVALGVLQVSLNAAAQVDISRRPATEVRGSKIGWRLVSLINIFGP